MGETQLSPTLTVAEAAEMLGVGRSAAYELIRTGKFPVEPLRLGRRYRIPTAKLLTVLGISETSTEAGDAPREMLTFTIKDGEGRVLWTGTLGGADNGVAEAWDFSSHNDDTAELSGRIQYRQMHSRDLTPISTHRASRRSARSLSGKQSVAVPARGHLS